MFASTAFFVGAESSPNVLQQRRGEGAVIEEGKQEEEAGTWSAFHKVGRFMFTNVYAFVFLTYSLWTLLGVLFYKYYDNYTTSTAYYYAMEAGLSIGFCNPTEKDDWSRLFTIFYVLFGSCFVSGAIGVFAASILSSNPSLVKVRHEFGAFGIEDESGKITVGSFFRFFWYHLKLLVGWYSNRSFFISGVLFFVWITWGTAYVRNNEGYSIITSLYWAVTTISTGGLESASCINGTNGPTCDIGDLRRGIMGIYMMIGVPIYAIFIAQVARYTVFAALRAREEKLLNQPIADSDFLFAANILSPEGSETLVMGEFILLELMRLGLTNPSQIENIKAKFRRIDKVGRGELDIDDLRKIGVVVPRKLHSVEVSRRIRNRSMDLFGAIRYSATNLTDAIIAATANLQLGSPGHDRSASRPLGDSSHPDDLEYADHIEVTTSRRTAAATANSGSDAHDHSAERKANDQGFPLEAKRQSTGQSKASFRKSGRKSQYLVPRDHNNDQCAVGELIHEDGYFLAGQSRLQAHNNARQGHKQDEEGDAFADFYYNKEEALSSPATTRSPPATVNDHVDDALEGGGRRSSPQQSEARKPAASVILGEGSEGGYSDQDEDEIIHVSYAHQHQHHVRFQGDNPPPPRPNQTSPNEVRQNEKQQVGNMQRVSSAMDI